VLPLSAQTLRGDLIGWNCERVQSEILSPRRVPSCSGLGCWEGSGAVRLDTYLGNLQPDAQSARQSNSYYLRLPHPLSLLSHYLRVRGQFKHIGFLTPWVQENLVRWKKPVEKGVVGYFEFDSTGGRSAIHALEQWIFAKVEESRGCGRADLFRL
jgi:hypothetical protein